MSQLPFAKYDAEFRKDHPETIGETDQTFDLANYCEWLEKRVERLERAETLIGAMDQILDKVRDAGTVEDVFAMTSIWDGAECDGGCWHEEAKAFLEGDA